jgi:hypothetical protein
MMPPLNSNAVIYIPTKLINTHIYYNDERLRSESIVYLSPRGATSLPNELVAVLYPNSKLPIKIFDSPKIPHPQNLGTITEIEKGELLRSNRYYLTYNSDEYVLEAIECGCQIVDIDNIMDYTTKACAKEPTDKVNYKDFLQGVFDV